MILRVTAALALIFGGGLFLTFLWRMNEGPNVSQEARHLRQMKERTETPDRFTAFTFDSFAALPHTTSLASYEALERRGVSLVGYARWMNTWSDGDFHLDLTPVQAPLGDAQAMPVTAEITDWWRRGSQRWTYERLSAEFRPHEWAVPDWPQPPRLVRVSGWLMYDSEYDAPFRPSRTPIIPNQAGGRLTGWEIHPVTRIELWNDSLRRFVEYPR